MWGPYLEPDSNKLLNMHMTSVRRPENQTFDIKESSLLSQVWKQHGVMPNEKSLLSRHVCGIIYGWNDITYGISFNIMQKGDEERGKEQNGVITAELTKLLWSEWAETLRNWFHFPLMSLRTYTSETFSLYISARRLCIYTLHKPLKNLGKKCPVSRLLTCGRSPSQTNPQVKNAGLPCLVWLRGLNAGLRSKRFSPVWSLIRANAWAAAGGLREAAGQCFFPSLPPSLK